MFASNVMSAGPSVTKTYATWDAANKSSLISLTGGDLLAYHNTSASWDSVKATQPKSTGKWVCEFTVNASSNNMVGLANSSFPVLANYLSLNPTSGGIGISLGNTLNANGMTALGGAGSGLTYMLAVDAGAGKAWFCAGGSWLSGDPVAGTSPSLSWTPTSIYICCSSYGNYSPPNNLPGQVLLNTGNSAFSNAVPSGFNPGWFA